MLRVLITFLLLVCGSPAQAHESLPVVIVIEEKADDIFALRMQLPPAIDSSNTPDIAMPSQCRPLKPLQQSGQTGLYRCKQAIGDGALHWTYPKQLPSIPTFVRLALLSGETHTLLVGPGETTMHLPVQESWQSVALQYLEMGIEHLLFGYDHLIFLLCLIWIAGTFRRVLLAVTGFTLAHSITLALSAMSVIRISVPPVEAAIALSIIFLAREIAIGRRDTLTWRHPMLISSLFGLLHGLGFAAALNEIGLPQTQLVTGLAFFNIGVELGQCAIVAAVFGAIALGRRFVPKLASAGFKLNSPSLPAISRRVTIMAAGGLSAFWFIDRTTGFF
ncbi:MAG: HupE/UreJ family protein [Sphingomonadales bacterium]|nr:HupE/UreJ family protein [Sphingomonadales bacterium]